MAQCITLAWTATHVLTSLVYVPSIHLLVKPLVHAHAQIFHFYTKKYTQKYLGPSVEAANQQYPWDKKKPIVFGRWV